jgi:hypothetical protein
MGRMLSSNLRPRRPAEGSVGALLGGFFRPPHCRAMQNSNRNNVRIEFALSYWKQTLAAISNRNKNRGPANVQSETNSKLAVAIQND